MNNKYYFKNDTKLTNYFLCDVIVDGIKYSSSEAAYHSQKFLDEDIKKITEIMLKKVEERLKSQKYIVEIDSEIVKKISEQGFDNNFGGRPLRSTIQNLVEDRISEEILAGNLKKNKKWTLKI